MLTYYLTSFATAASAIGLGLFVLFKNPKARVNQTWFLMSMFVGLWSATFATSIFSPAHDRALFLTRTCNVAAAFIPVFFFHFCIAITQTHSKQRSLILHAGYASSLLILVLSGTEWFIPRMRPISIFPFYAVPGPIFVFFTIHFHAYVLLSEYILFKKLRTTKDARLANQIRYIMIATILGFGTAVASFLPIYGVALNPMSTHFIWLYVAIISYAIVKHRLMDIRIIFRKGLIYSLLISLITLIYFALVFVSGTLFQNYVGRRSILATALIFTIIALGFKPLERKLQEWVDKFIFKRTRQMLEAENELLMEEMRKQDRMKGVATLAAGMAHEIKNPLTSIKTFAQYLPEKYDDPEFRLKFQSIIGDEVDRINNIVKQLLEFAKPRPLTLQKGSIHQVIDSTLDLLTNNLYKSGVIVKKSYEAVGEIQMDLQQIRQVFLNLFLNSIQAMPKGGKLTITTRNEPMDDGRPATLITVEDSGIGIAKEDLGRIFDPFYTTNNESGTGLGLAIVYGIIQEHDGIISVESKAGSTIFSIRLLSE